MTIIPFNQTATANFQFNPVLDGTTYVAICTYNSYAARFYISIYDTSGNLIMIRPIVGSPDEYDINLLFGYFQASTLLYRVSSNSFEIAP